MTTLLVLVIATVLLAAAWRDLAVRRIPNTTAAIVAGAGLALRAVEGPGPASVTLAAAGALFAVLFLGFVRGILGGGDVKLATAAALGLPPGGIWILVVATALAGGVLSLVYLLAQRLGLPRVKPLGRTHGIVMRVVTAECWRFNRRGPLPYGLAITAGSLIAFGNQMMVD
ncbi:A24 family peptidase [Elioraea sp.]|uniref:A24 family peptidase n=1 Tax=Elioraea sp. TaxID=2185103 RepID=UPI003F71AD2F